MKIAIKLPRGRKEDLRNTIQKNITCAFGVGLSWGTAYFETDHIVVPDLIDI